MHFSYDYAGKTHVLELEQDADGVYVAHIGEQVYRFRAQAVQQAWQLQLLDMPSAGAEQPATRQHLIATAVADKARYVQVDGSSYALSVTERGTRQRKASAGGGDLTAQMPGLVLDVRVSVGESVESGQVLVVLEAMKMEIRVSAPQAGIVKRLLVNKGDIVERGQHLIELAEA
jgi:biotin carboxyl carrier protein